ncbi:rhamnan synthesis F family protein [Methylocystis sp.]|uniref:rhamnosyltransferase WsaF family glycosyltransferase n=1 Tax=Methylocystis sp. TaxID=1911079 RepID=UPI0025D4E899|nr:rhamnan synthesis F family protein [Methylocystis sp.]
MSFPNKISSPFRHLKFDHNFYRDHHPDLERLSVPQLHKHFLLHGWRENRLFNPQRALQILAARNGPLPDDFTWSGYCAVNPDLATSFKREVQYKIHYLQFGRAEGRGYLNVDGAFRCEGGDGKRKSFLYTYELVKPDGIVPARRPVNEQDFAIATPFGFTPPERERKIAVFIHCFYPDVLPLLLEKLQRLPCEADLFLSTDTHEKKAKIEKICASRRGNVEVRVFPNRGRDVAPKFFGFADVYQRYEIFLHLHTKKSPHGGDPLAKWRDYLVDTLIGSREIASSNLSLFDDPKMGIVFPQHMFDVRGILNWGYDYDIARGLLRRAGVGLSKNLPLEFPSGSMFWGRSAAIRPLLDLDLRFEDFAVESGQIDGTLAHAVERTILMFAERSGHEWLKVARRDLYPLQQTILDVNSMDDIRKARLKVFRPCLCGADASVRPAALGIQETRPLLPYPSRNSRPRLNLLAPSVNPRHMFGGLNTALAVFSSIADALGADFDRRVVVTNAKIDEEGFASLPNYTPAPYEPTLDEARCSLVDAYERSDGLRRLDLRENDIFLATAWWTANFAEQLERDRARIFGKDLPFVYLIQDDEPYFYGWGSKFALAAATYKNGDGIRAIINSEELFATILSKHRFKSACCIPFQLNQAIAERLSPKLRERTILVYGRPSVARNAFELICDSLFLWQQQDPVRASRWRIIFAGEQFAPGLAEPVQNFEVAGKLPLEDYAALLNTASVGVSIMLSPHPSYPPLEMIEAGLVTVVNDYAEKNLIKRNPNVISPSRLDGDSLADAIENAVDRGEKMIGRVTPRGRVAQLPLRQELEFGADRMASLLCEDLVARQKRSISTRPGTSWWRSFRRAAS